MNDKHNNINMIKADLRKLSKTQVIKLLLKQTAVNQLSNQVLNIW